MKCLHSFVGVSAVRQQQRLAARRMLQRFVTMIDFLFILQVTITKNVFLPIFEQSTAGWKKGLSDLSPLAIAEIKLRANHRPRYTEMSG